MGTAGGQRQRLCPGCRVHGACRRDLAAAGLRAPCWVRHVTHVPKREGTRARCRPRASRLASTPRAPRISGRVQG